MISYSLQKGAIRHNLIAFFIFMEWYKNFSFENIVAEIDGIVYTEEWVDCKLKKSGKWYNLGKKYQVSNFGRVKSLAYRNNGAFILKQYRFKKENRHSVRLGNCGLRESRFSTTVHRLMMESFDIPNPENKRTINHIDGVPANNFIKNLEWNTYSENICHALRLKLLIPKQGVNHYRARLTDKQVLEIRSKKKPAAFFVKKYSMALDTIYAIRKGSIWKHLGGVTNKVGKGEYLGENVYNAKLSEEMVLEIYNSKERTIDLANRLNVVESAVGNVRRGTGWAWVAKKHNICIQNLNYTGKMKSKGTSTF